MSKENKVLYKEVRNSARIIGVILLVIAVLFALVNIIF